MLYQMFHNDWNWNLNNHSRYYNATPKMTLITRSITMILLLQLYPNQALGIYHGSQLMTTYSQECVQDMNHPTLYSDNIHELHLISYRSHGFPVLCTLGTDPRKCTVLRWQTFTLCIQRKYLPVPPWEQLLDFFFLLWVMQQIKNAIIETFRVSD